MWEKYKRDKLDGFLRAVEKGEVDEDIVDLLNLINSLENYVTLSSCSGRIVVMDLREVGDKRTSRLLAKWHVEARIEEVVRAALESKETAWLFQHPPILHVACRTQHHAEKLMKAANNAGFKRSGVISFRNWVVEIASWERIELPIAISGKLIVPQQYLDMVVKLSNLKLRRGKERLGRLFEELKIFSE